MQANHSKALRVHHDPRHETVGGKALKLSVMYSATIICAASKQHMPLSSVFGVLQPLRTQSELIYVWLPLECISHGY